MIKRRFYQQDHGDGNADSDSDSDSASDSPALPDQEEDDEEEEEEAEETNGEEDHLKSREEEEEGPKPRLPSPGSGYESEDSSRNEVDGDCSGLLANEEDHGSEKHKNNQLVDKDSARESNNAATAKNAADLGDPEELEPDVASCILKCKSVFRCRLCPRIICLNMETVKAHLESKRHARSEKLLGEGRLKLMLNSDGEPEEDQETHAERYARTIALTQNQETLDKKDSGRQRQSRRRKKRLRNRSEKNGLEMERSNKRSHKTEN